MENEIVESDFKEILDCDIPFEKFKNKTFLITGATGLIGSLIVKFLLFLNKKGMNINIVGLIRNNKKAKRIYKNYNDKHLSFCIHNLGSGAIDYNKEVDYVVHGAAVTQSKTMIKKPVETILLSVDGTNELLDLAVRKNIKSMVYISSMEVYGQPLSSKKITEDDLGELSLTNIRSGYPESKRLCENLCAAYADEYELNVSSARLAQTFGAGILPSENRVFAQFARSIINEEDIVLHTLGNSEGNYIYTSDMIKAIFTLLLYGERGQAYNVTNEQNHMTIKQMAELVVKNFGNKNLHVKIDIPEENMGYAPDVKMWLSSEKLRSLANGIWSPTVGLTEMYNRLINYLRLTK